MMGHWGVGGQMAYADLTYQVGFMYGTNYNNPIHGIVMDHRYEALKAAMFECVRNVEHRSKHPHWV